MAALARRLRTMTIRLLHLWPTPRDDDLDSVVQCSRYGTESALTSEQVLGH